MHKKNIVIIQQTNQVIFALRFNLKPYEISLFKPYLVLNGQKLSEVIEVMLYLINVYQSSLNRCLICIIGILAFNTFPSVHPDYIAFRTRKQGPGMLLSAFFGGVPARLTNTQSDMPYSGPFSKNSLFPLFWVLRPSTCMPRFASLRLLTRNEYGYPFNYNSMARTKPSTFFPRLWFIYSWCYFWPKDSTCFGIRFPRIYYANRSDNNGIPSSGMFTSVCLMDLNATMAVDLCSWMADFECVFKWKLLNANIYLLSVIKALFCVGGRS